MKWSNVVAKDDDRHGDALRRHERSARISCSSPRAASATRRASGSTRVGVKLDSRGYVAVDEKYRTSVPSILAAGDVVGFPALASASMEQGRVAVCHAFGFGYKRSVSHTMPYGIYTIPELSGVGETENTCQRERSRAYVVGRAPYANNARGKIVGDTDGMTKLVVCAETRKLLGVHVVGENATELVHIGQTVLHLEGTVDLFIDMVFNFPTLAETYKYAAYDCLNALAKRKRGRDPCSPILDDAPSFGRAGCRARTSSCP